MSATPLPTRAVIAESKQIRGVTVSVLMPAFNDEANIRRSLTETSRSLSRLGVGHEIVVIDDGSRDGTRLAASEVTENLPVKVVGYNVNRGKGEALRYGSRFALGEVSLFLDCGGEINPLDLVEYLMALRHAELAIGSKRHIASRVEAPLERKFLSTCFNYLARLLTGIKYSDTQSGLKAFRTSSLRRIMPLLSVKKYAFDVEILVVASLLKMKVVELPVEVKLKARFKAKNVLRMLVDLLGITYRLRISRWYQHNLSNGSAKYSPLLRW
jgi:glycosyltransferase involved in cell wall biosynthesis